MQNTLFENPVFGNYEETCLPFLLLDFARTPKYYLGIK